MPNDQRYPQQQEIDFDRFFREHQRTLERFIAIRVGSVQEAQDLAAEVICQLIAYCQKCHDREIHHRALMYKIARNRIADYFAQRRTKLREIPIEDAPQLPAPGYVPTMIDTRQELELALTTLRDIRDEYREVIILHANVGLTIAEIAEMMEKPPANVRVLLFRARRALKRALKERGAI
ncbi:RNA polymerase sigma factor [Candidatus Uhrbacteria bacterium]|nr:RNA polymerase sigma factor [Candidatus Uhrbacteria bacterium]